jgi:hypothetical protein
MARVVSSATILLPGEKVWPVVADVAKWVLYVPDARKKGWGDSWHAAGPVGVGTELRMVSQQDSLMQRWEVVDWRPGQGLRAESRRIQMPLFPMAASFAVTLTAVSATETKLESTCEVRFTAFAWPLNLVVPLRRDIELMLTRWEQGIVAALGG